MKTDSPTVGVGACLVGKPVRYNGESKRKNPHIEGLSQHVTLRSFCPEVGVGMTVPRETVRLVGDLGMERIMDSATQTIDYTRPMQTYAANVLNSAPELSGYILVKASPSCGLERVKRYNTKGKAMLNDSVGVFTAELKKRDPLLPMEDDGRLHDAGLRENFVTRVFTYHDWKAFIQQPITHFRLTEFWSKYKYLLMSHHVPTYKEIGRLLSNAKSAPVDETANLFIELLMSGLSRMATRNTRTNVLQHIRGYLKKHIETDDKQEMDALITQYRCGEVPLVVPVTLLRHHFRRHASDYIGKQIFMQPYPEQLSLRNLI